MKTTFLTCVILFTLSYSLSAQMMIEKDYPLSRKVNVGYLGNIDVKENGNFDLVYFLKSGKDKVNVDIMSFDSECNLLGTKKDEMELKSAQKKYKNFKYKGDEVIGQNVAVSANLAGKMTYKKRQILSRWNWWAGRYVQKIKLLDNQKLLNADGEQYRFCGAYEVAQDSCIYALAYDPGKNNSKGEGNYDFIRVNYDGKVDVLQNIKYPGYMTPLFSKPLMDEYSGDISNDEMPRDWILVLAPDAGSTNNLAYLRISPKGEVKENITIPSPASGFRILNAYSNGNSVSLYGPAIAKDGKSAFQLLGTTVSATSMDADEVESTQTDMNSSILGGGKKIIGLISGKEEMIQSQSDIDELLDAKKYTDFIVARIANGAVEMINATPMKDLNDKAVAGPDMKKPLSFDGKKFITDNFQILSDGTMMLALQDYKDTKAGGGGNKLLGAIAGVSTSTSGPAYTKVYEGMYLLQFSKDGKLVRNYTVALDQKNKKGFMNKSPMTADNFPAGSYVIESKDGKSVNWVMKMVKAIDKDRDSYTGWNSTTTTTTYTPLYSIQYGQIDLTSGTSSEFKTLGDDEKNKFYLLDRYNMVRIGDYLYFFSETEKSDKLLVSRLKIGE